MHLSLLDILVVILYATFVLIVAQFVSREKDDRQKYSPGSTSAKGSLPWWAIGTSLIAANISAEQIIGMSGSAYVLGMAIASYEWTAAAVLLIVGKYFLPIFLKNQIYTMPEFLKRRYGPRIQLVMAVFWLILYVFVNLTAILWLGATAVHTVTGLTVWPSLILLGLFAGNYALYVGVKAVAFTDVVQVCMLVLGGLVVVFIALEKISGGSGIAGLTGGLAILATRLPDHFHMILGPDSPYYKYVPGISVLIGGMWIVHLAYWGFNQYIIQRALTAESVREAQKGVVLAAFLKLLIPVLVVLPGIAAVVLAKHLPRADEAYPQLMTLLPGGLLGLVFVALIAAIIASMGSTLNSVSTIFTNDILRPIRRSTTDREFVIAGRAIAIVALIIAVAVAKPLLGHVGQAFQYIQEYTGFFSPGITVIFLLGMFWKRATETGALVAAIGSVAISLFYRFYFPEVAFLNRMAFVFLICLALAVIVSLSQKAKPQSSTIDVANVDYSTSTTFNIAGLLVISILVALYAILW
ncbi:MAG: sodium/solute symporter [Alphaproteobacteria bacterium]|nr:sodium/solute symporter [Alphaproteobacteria bacterium]